MSQKSEFVVDVIVPARNCAETLGRTLDLLPARLVRSAVVVDRKSDDNTGFVARDRGAVLLTSDDVGYGRACKLAITHLEDMPRRPDAVVIVPPQLVGHQDDVERLLEPIHGQHADLVLAVSAGKPVAATNRALLRLIQVVYGHHFADIQPVRAIRFDALVALGLADDSDGWNVEMLLKAIKLGLRISEVAVTVRAPRKPRAAAAYAAGRSLWQVLLHSTVR